MDDSIKLVGDTDLLIASIIMPAKVEEVVLEEEETDDAESTSDIEGEAGQDNETEELDHKDDSE